MVPQRAWLTEGLASRMHALEAALAGLESGEPGIVDAIHRIARNLRVLALANGYSELSAVASAAEAAPATDIRSRLNDLLRLLGAMVKEGGAGRLSLLVVEPDLLTARALEESLTSPSRTILVAGSAAGALEYIREHDIALILLDLVLPDGDGRQLLARLRESPRTAGIPVYMLTARTGEQPRTECFALGAEGFFEKPLQLDTVAVAVAARLQRAGEAAFESRHDPLTGLPNRAAFYETFDRLRAMAMRERTALSLGLVDLDHMRQINEKHGRVAGNEVLRRTASLLSMTLRDTDLVARWSGEEFVLLLPRAGADAGRRAMDKALERLREESFTGADGGGFSASFTGGVVKVRDGLAVEQLLNQADRLLYLGKSSGRNRVLAGDSMINPPLRRILLAEGDPYLAGAIERRLTREGFEVLHVPDGAAALQAATEHGASLVIADTEMPRMDGFTLLGRLRELPAYRQTPVLMLTAMGSEAHIVRAFDAGADDYLLKPFSSPELIARVRRLVTPP